MSLFTIKEVWTVNCGETSNYFCDSSVQVGNVDSALDGSVKVVVGAFSGLLRIIGSKNVDRSTQSVETSEDSNSKASILAELHLGAPILQIELGRFVRLILHTTTI